MSPVRVAVVSRYQVVRFGLRAILEQRPEVQVLERSPGAGDAAEPDVVLYDLAGLVDPSSDDLPYLARTSAKVVGIVHDPSTHLAGRARAANLVGTLPLNSSVDELFKVVLSVVREPDAQSPRAVLPFPQGATNVLNGRELEVIARLAAGMSNAEIGRDLFIGINTVKTHLRRAYRKMGVHTRAQAILWYLDRQL
ncbi:MULTISPECIES: response regulator transcription factor [unclassified Nocardioides]|uniref:response regulator transcription factor n=1 Tax=unclassified Nocardioides TaxID=2615069 RepID=UPI003014B0AA